MRRNTVKPVLRDKPSETISLERPDIPGRFSIFNIIEPVTRGKLSCKTIFSWPMGWSFKTGSTVFIFGEDQKSKRIWMKHKCLLAFLFQYIRQCIHTNSDDCPRAQHKSADMSNTL